MLQWTHQRVSGTNQGKAPQRAPASEVARDARNTAKNQRNVAPNSLLRALGAVQDADWAEKYMCDGLHFTPHGQEKVGYLLRSLLRHQWPDIRWVKEEEKLKETQGEPKP